MNLSRPSVDSLSIRKRLAELQQEIKQIFHEDCLYKMRGNRRGPQDIADHENRMRRMGQILEDIAKLTPRKN